MPEILAGWRSDPARACYALGVEQLQRAWSTLVGFLLAPATLIGLTAGGTPLLASPDGKCELRILGPIELAGRFEWYLLTVQPGGTLDSQAHEPGSREHLTVHSGALEVQAGPESTRVRHGETARYAVDVPHRIHNPGKTVAQALLVVLHPV